MNIPVLLAQRLSKILLSGLLSKAPDKFCSLLSAGNTPLHLAVMMGHKGESYLELQAHMVYFGLGGWLSESFCWSISLCFVFLFVCVFLYCTFAKLSTSRHLSQITKHIPEGKMLMHERRGCVYGLSARCRGTIKQPKQENNFLSL